MSDMVPVSRAPKKAKPEPVPVVAPVVKASSPVREINHIRQNKHNDAEPIPQKMGCALWLLIPLCALFLIVTIGGLIASAKITITPKQFTGSVDIITTLTPESKTLPFYTATAVATEELVLNSGAAIDASSTARDSFATGTVRFYNTSNTQVTVPAGARITLPRFMGTDGQPLESALLYATEKSLVIPKGTIAKPRQKDVTVTAVVSGTTSNVDPTDFALIKPITGISIRGVTALSGGALASDINIDEAQFAQAKTQLINSFDEEAVLVQRVSEELPAEMITLPVSFIASQPQFEVIALESDTGSKSGQVRVVAKKQVTITFVKRTDMARLIGDRLGAPDTLLLTMKNFDGATITTSALGSAENLPKTIPLRITGNIAVQGQVVTRDIISGIVGKSKKDAKAFIAEIPEVERSIIHMMPFWRRIFPLDAKKISVTLLNP